MAIEVFNRHENKYRLSCETFLNLQNRLSEYMELDEYNKYQQTYTITNLYYDTADSHLIRASLEKPRYKEKLRLRAYGVPDAETTVYVEIKKKYSGTVNKRRSAMGLEEAYEFLSTGILPEIKPWHNTQVLREIAYMLEINDLYPSLYLAYDRRAFFAIDRHDLRVSFDTNIRTRRYDLALESGDYGKQLLGKGEWLMEIKAEKSIPLWLCHLLSEYEIYPSSFSKYGEEYTRTLGNARTRRNIYLMPENEPAADRAANAS